MQDHRPKVPNIKDVKILCVVFLRRVSKDGICCIIRGEASALKTTPRGSPRPSPPLTVRLHEKAPEPASRSSPHQHGAIPQTPADLRHSRDSSHQFSTLSPDFLLIHSPFLAVTRVEAIPSAKPSPAFDLPGGDASLQKRCSPAPGPAVASTENLSTPALQPLVLEMSDL